MTGGCIPSELIWMKGLSLSDIRVYAIMRALDIYDRGVVQVSNRYLAEHYGCSHQVIGRKLKRLIDAGALELLYGGRFAPGHVSGDANVYRFVDFHRHPKRAPNRVPDGHPKRAPSRAPNRVPISSPTENRRVARGDGSRSAVPHAYPCCCDDCTAAIVAMTLPPGRAPVR